MAPVAAKDATALGRKLAFEWAFLMQSARFNLPTTITRYDYNSSCFWLNPIPQLLQWCAMCEKSITLRNWASTHKPDCHFSLHRLKQQDSQDEGVLGKTDQSQQIQPTQRQHPNSSSVHSISDSHLSKKRKAIEIAVPVVGQLAKAVAADSNHPGDVASTLAHLKSSSSDTRSILSDSIFTMPPTSMVGHSAGGEHTIASQEV